MKTYSRQHLPLVPLLHAYTRAGVPSIGELHHLPDLGPRFAAILSATAKFFFADYLENASANELSDALVRFYEACVQPPLHVETLRRRAGIVRHALTYLLRGRDPLPIKAAACLEVSGAYHVAGLGPSFWSAILQALSPSRNPGWTPAICAGLERLGLATWKHGDGTQAVCAALLSAYDRIRAQEPVLSALHVDHFLTLVAVMRGRNLPVRTCAEHGNHDSFAAAVQRERARLPLRERLKERGQTLARGQEQLEMALANSDGKGIGDALSAADLAGCLRSPLDWGEHAETLTLWVGRLWESDDPYRTLAAFWAAEPLPGAGLWLPAAVLHLRDPQNFAPWNEEIRAAYALRDDSDSDEPPAERYRLFNEGIAWLRQRYHLHPLEIPAVLAGLGHETEMWSTRSASAASFSGFCADTFHFLSELAHNNKREWMERQRDRYRFAVREPLVELCRVLAERYVEPVLRGVHGWQLDSEPRSGRALTSICKNAFGRTQPYNTALWIAFCRRTESGRREDVQFFVRLEGNGLRYGLRLGRKARTLLPRFRQQLRRYAELLFRALRDRGALSDYRFGNADANGSECAVAAADDLLVWSEERSFEVSRSLSADAALMSGDELAGEILLTFDRLLPLYACAVEEDAHAFLCRCLGGTADGEPYSESDFQRATLLGSDWLERTRHLLELKRQLILQGVPGTGKTHIARHLARLLTRGRDGRIRLVQFHPAYSYEEFVEGIKVRSVTVDGRSDVTYPVEAGLLCAFAEEASRRPAEPHVLLIDEINRGNLPRIFGELLYLLEYREQSVCLPCSRRHFRLPTNLYLLATMNAADRSIALLDKALRRRFSFMDMPPDADVLSRWLQTHTPVDGPAFAERVRMLFERLNARLRTDLGPQGQIGHSYFMVPDLDEARLRLIWQHHIRPLLAEHFAAQPARLASYEIDKLLNDSSPRGERRRRVEAI